MILEGTSWKIGNGTKVKIYEDRWVPGTSKCKEVIPVWFASPMGIHIPVHYEVDFGSWLLHMLSIIDDEAATSIFNLVWALWKRRNEWVHNSRHDPVDSVLSKAASIRVPPSAETPNSSTVEPTQWMVPQNGVVKINIDAALGSGQYTVLTSSPRPVRLLKGQYVLFVTCC
ncbi:hypothetical protein RIF29_22380 [Crotalaria pallida]|uniref:Uncharacterized protein n=1 Tax=Crotalaria pallida TaxID=3830 RepID=A0AAN9F690_CROPI